MPITPTGIPSWVVYITLVLLGVIPALASAMLVRYWKRSFDPGPGFFKDMIGLAASILSAPLLGAVAELMVSVRSVDIEPSEAAVLALGSALATWLLIIAAVMIINPILICVTVILPLAFRCGPRCAGQAIKHIFVFKDREHSISEFWRRYDAGVAWDELAIALADCTGSFQSIQFAAEALNAITDKPPSSEQDRQKLADVANDYLNQSLGGPLKEFQNHTGANKFRFAIWRIDDTGHKAVRVWSLPTRDKRLPISLWKENRAGEAASHLTEVLLQDKDDVLTSSDSRLSEFPNGAIGKHYIAARGTPLTCRGDGSPWGVLYVDLCHGSVNLDSKAVGLLCRRIAKVIEPLGPLLKQRTISEART